MSGSPHGVLGCTHPFVAGCCCCSDTVEATTTSPAMRRRQCFTIVLLSGTSKDVPLLVLLTCRRIDHAQRSVHQLFDELHALVLEQLLVRLDAAVERHADRPRAR